MTQKLDDFTKDILSVCRAQLAPYIDGLNDEAQAFLFMLLRKGQIDVSEILRATFEAQQNETREGP